MRKFISKLLICSICYILFSICFLNIVNAANEDEEINYLIPEQIILDTPEVIENSIVREQNFVDTSPIYEFLDEDNKYNVVLASKNNVYWRKFDDNLNLIKEITIPALYKKDYGVDALEGIANNFGNAIYKDGYLYVVYGTIIKENVNEPVLGVVKYDKDGNEVAKVEVAAGSLNPFPTDYTFATSLLFYGGNCALTIKDDVLCCLTVTYIYDNHNASAIAFFDTETLNHLSDYHAEYFGRENEQKYVDAVLSLYVGHSFDQRVLATENGDYVFLERGDASPRGIVLTKLTYNEEKDAFDRFRYVPFHFREPMDGTWGYNNTYASCGNLIELSDGYLYIGSAEKTLERNLGDKINEGWNIYVQKFKKDFEKYETDEERVVFSNEEVRTVVGEYEKPQYNGKTFLTGNEKDYGIKWITDYEEGVVSDVRAIEMENEEIALIWKKMYWEMTEYGGNYNTDKEPKYYVAVINKNGEIIKEPHEIINVKMSRTIDYVYKNGNIYWTTTDGRSSKMIVNKIDIVNIDSNAKEFKYTEYETGKIEDKEIIYVDSNTILEDFYTKNNFPILDREKYSISVEYEKDNGATRNKTQ